MLGGCWGVQGDVEGSGGCRGRGGVGCGGGGARGVRGCRGSLLRRSNSSALSS